MVHYIIMHDGGACMNDNCWYTCSDNHQVTGICRGSSLAGYKYTIHKRVECVCLTYQGTLDRWYVASIHTRHASTRVQGQAPRAVGTAGAGGPELRHKIQITVIMGCL